VCRGKDKIHLELEWDHRPEHEGTTRYSLSSNLANSSLTLAQSFLLLSPVMTIALDCCMLNEVGACLIDLSTMALICSSEMGDLSLIP
jgi:hypothetical protein